VRWAHPERGLLGPAEFIDLAEETGLIRPIGRWVLNEAARQASLWEAKFAHRLTMAVNLSAKELASLELVSEVKRTLSETGIQPDTLVLEITERVLMVDTV